MSVCLGSLKVSGMMLASLLLATYKEKRSDPDVDEKELTGSTIRGRGPVAGSYGHK